MRRGTWVSVTALSPHPVRTQPQPAFKNICDINRGTGAGWAMVTPRGALSWRPLAETHVFQDRGDLGDRGVPPVLGELSLQADFSAAERKERHSICLQRKEERDVILREGVR